MTESKATLLADLSRLYFFLRTAGPGVQLDYEALFEVLADGMQARIEPRLAWTAWDRANSGQSSYIGYVRSQLDVQVESVEPREALPVLAHDPRSPEADVVRELVRFDARIAFALARTAPEGPVVVLSDSYSLAAPLAEATARGWTVSLAWWAEGLDRRWMAHVNPDKDGEPPIDFIDLSEYGAKLFGREPPDDRSVLGALP